MSFHRENNKVEPVSRRGREASRRHQTAAGSAHNEVNVLVHDTSAMKNHNAVKQIAVVTNNHGDRQSAIINSTSIT